MRIGFVTSGSFSDILIVRMSNGYRQCFFMLLAVLAVLFLPIAVSHVSAQATGDDVEAKRAQLEADLANIEEEIKAQEQLLDSKQRERVSLERDVAILDAKIEKAKLELKQRDLVIGGLESDILDKEGTISDLDDKLTREKQSLAQLIRQTNQIDDYSMVEIVLAQKDISDFFGDIDRFDSIQKSLNESFAEIGDTKDKTEDQKDQLESKREQEVELRNLSALQKQKTEDQEAEKQQILKVTKGQEAAYQDIVKAKQKTAAEIRAELFTLRGSAAIPFAQALNYANDAFKITGVRPAFILGTIAEESNLGENIGTGNWKTDMHPTRDRPIFEEICQELGLDPDLMPVSKKPWFGWGGAMGPAQFIPSTWILYKDRIGEASGQVPPNPWDPRTAFIASALLLEDNGADRGSPAAERLASLRYFAGWKNAEKPEYAFYGDEVMELASKYQGLINVLSESSN